MKRRGHALARRYGHAIDERFDEHFSRGLRDAQKDRPAIFRRTSRGIEAEGDDPMADNWSEEARESYLQGYESYEA